MLLYIYMATTVLSCTTVFITGITAKKRLKRKGYIFIEQDKKPLELILDSLNITLNCLLPIHNIKYALAFTKENNSKELEATLLKQGKIIIETSATDIKNQPKTTQTKTKVINKISKAENKSQELIPQKKVIKVDNKNNNIKEQTLLSEESKENFQNNNLIKKKDK